MAAENASLGAGGFDKSFAVMDKELDGKPHIQSVILSSDGNGDACGASLQLRIRVGQVSRVLAQAIPHGPLRTNL